MVKPVREGTVAEERKALVQNMKGHVLKAVAGQCRLTNKTKGGNKKGFTTKVSFNFN